MWRGYSTFQSNTIAGSDAGGQARFDVDVKSMRKIRNVGDQLILATKVTGGAQNWTTCVRLSILLALS
jgi:hypothetical protein